MRKSRIDQDLTAGDDPVFGACEVFALVGVSNARTGCPVVVNTSFNVRGEPIVNTPEDAFRCFMGTDMEVLVVGNCFLRKEDQDPALKLDYKDAFELD